MKSFLYTYSGEYLRTPMATVMVAVYNAAQYLRETIESVLAQDFKDFELLLLDDGSVDNSVDIINSFTDPRIVLVQHKNNLGVVDNGNCGFGLAKGKYIFLLGHDDLCRSNRLSKQIAFMEENPAIGICGSWMRTFPHEESEFQYPTQPDVIHCEMLFFNPIGAPSVVIRKQEMFEKQIFYRNYYACAEDYDLWAQALAQGVVLANLPEVLVDYRIHENQMSSKSSERQMAVTMQVQYDLLRFLGLNPSKQEMEIHSLLGKGNFIMQPSVIEASAQWLVKLSQANIKSGKLPNTVFSELLRRRWEIICKKSVALFGQRGAAEIYNNVMREMNKQN